MDNGRTFGQPVEGLCASVHAVPSAAIYCRISDDREGDGLGVGRQEEDCRAVAAARGWNVSPGHVYVDNDRGASTLSKKKRPAYDRMIAAVEDGQVDAIAYYSNSRLTRRPMEWLRLIQFVNTHGLELASKVSGQHDLTTADGRAVALTIAAWDAAEAERIGERQRRKQQQMRESGKHHGGRRLFGYAPAVPGEAGSREALHPTEAPAIAAAVQTVLAGGSCWQVMQQWNRDGVLTATGKQWRDPGSVKRTLLNPTLAGLLTHQGEVIGEGDWPAVIGRAEQEAMRVLLGDKARAGAGRRHILSGLVFCACGNRMSAQVSVPHHNRYACMKHRGGCGKVTRNKPWLEARVDEAMTYLLLQHGAREYAPTDEARRGELDESVARLERLIGDTAARMTDGTVSPEDGWPLVAEWRTRINEARAQIARLIVVDARARSAILSPADALRLWRGDDFDARRQLLETHIGRIVVKPLGRGRPWGANVEVPADSIDIIPA